MTKHTKIFGTWCCLCSAGRCLRGFMLAGLAYQLVGFCSFALSACYPACFVGLLPRLHCFFPPTSVLVCFVGSSLCLRCFFLPANLLVCGLACLHACMLGISTRKDGGVASARSDTPTRERGRRKNKSIKIAELSSAQMALVCRLTKSNCRLRRSVCWCRQPLCDNKTNGLLGGLTTL